MLSSLLLVGMAAISSGQTPVANGPFPTTRTRVTVHSDLPLAKFPEHGLGIGVAVWDKNMISPRVARLIREAGFQVIRYPGGSYADLYQWKSHSATRGMDATIQPGTDFDAFLGLCEKSGTTPLITVNYGSNPEGTGGADPAYPADWVRHANLVKKAGVKYWEIGNEVYGNGFYSGQGWEVDLHAPASQRPEDRLANPNLGPSYYGARVAEFSRAMKAVDPTIRVGAVATIPGGWPDEVAPDWNTSMLQECGRDVDFVVVHWYGEGDSPKKIFQSLDAVPGALAKLRRKMIQVLGARGRELEIWMTEGDGSGITMRAPGAGFAAEHVLTWLANGAAHVNWWNLHNGLSHWKDIYDDQGLLSTGGVSPTVSQPPVDTPFPPYYGIALASQGFGPGDRFVIAKSDRPELGAHAALTSQGASVFLVNRDPDHATRVSLEGLRGYRLASRTEYRPGSTAFVHGALAGPIWIPANGVVLLRFERG